MKKEGGSRVKKEMERGDPFELISRCSSFVHYLLLLHTSIIYTSFSLSIPISLSHFTAANPWPPMTTVAALAAAAAG